MQEQFCREIIRLNAADSETPITVFIDTLGGDTRSSLFMCDAIEYSKAQVHGIVIGKAHSAGFRILQSCRTRTAYKNASLMFHGPAKNTRIDDKNWSFANRESRRLHDEQIKTYQKRSGQDIEKIRAWSQEEKIFTAQEAVKYRFLDKIV
jgi:ATP-dependent Clp protease protease subunit